MANYNLFKAMYPSVNVSPKSLGTNFRLYGNHDQGRVIDTAENIIVREAFFTLQGEMPYSGVPALFIRMGGCNRGGKKDIGCFSRGFQCDTDFQLKESEALSPSELFSKLSTLWDDFKRDHISEMITPPNLIVITGGEPTLQMHGALMEFLKMINTIKRCDSPIPFAGNRYSDLTIQFETNGDFPFPKELWDLDHVKLAIVVSPKFPNSENNWWRQPKLSEEMEVMIKQGRLKLFMRHLVVNPENADKETPIQLSSLKSLMHDITETHFEQIYVSPVTAFMLDDNGELAEDLMATQLNMEWALRIVHSYGFHLSLQTHKYLGIE